MPTPPFWLQTAMTVAGPCRSSGVGSGTDGRDDRWDRSDHRPGPGRCGDRSRRCPRRWEPRDGTGRRSGRWVAGCSRYSPLRSPLSVVSARPFRPGPPPKPSGSRRRSRGASPQPWTFVADRVSPRPRVRGRVHLAHRVHRHQCVDLSGRHRRVPQQFLDHANIGSTVEEMGGETVPQGVWRHRALESGALCRRRQHLPGALTGEPTPRALRNSAAVDRCTSVGRPRTRYASRASMAGPPTGTTRSLPPLPCNRTARVSVSMSSRSSPVASEMRAPQL